MMVMASSIKVFALLFVSGSCQNYEEWLAFAQSDEPAAAAGPLLSFALGLPETAADAERLFYTAWAVRARALSASSDDAAKDVLYSRRMTSLGGDGRVVLRESRGFTSGPRRESVLLG